MLNLLQSDCWLHLTRQEGNRYRIKLASLYILWSANTGAQCAGAKIQCPTHLGRHSSRNIVTSTVVHSDRHLRMQDCCTRWQTNVNNTALHFSHLRKLPLSSLHAVGLSTIHQNLPSETRPIGAERLAPPSAPSLPFEFPLRSGAYIKRFGSQKLCCAREKGEGDRGHASIGDARVPSNTAASRLLAPVMT